MKLFIRFFLSLSVFLLGGFSIIYANSQQERGQYAPVKGLEKAIAASYGDMFDNLSPAVLYASPDTEKKHNLVYAEENEDESNETFFLKKYTAPNNYFTAFYAPASGGFHSLTNKVLPSCTHFTRFSTDRYIVFRVFRI